MSLALSEGSRGRTLSRWRARCAACASRYSSLISEDSGRDRSFVSVSSGSDSSIIGTATLYFSVAQLPRSRSRQRELQKGNSAVVSESVGSLQMGHFSFTAGSQVWSDLSGACFRLRGLGLARTKPRRLKPVLLKPKSSALRQSKHAARARLPVCAPRLGAGHPEFPLRDLPGRIRASPKFPR